MGFANLWSPSESGSAHRGPEKILLEQGFITQDQLDAAIAHQRENPRLSLLEALVQSQAIDEMQALQTVAEYFKLPFARVTTDDIDGNIVDLLPLEYIKQKHVLPIRMDNQTVIVGISDPADIFLIDDLKRRLNRPLNLTVTPKQDIIAAVEEISDQSVTTKQVDDIIKDSSEDNVEVVNEVDEDVADLEKIAGESPVIRYVNFLISAAVKDDASDIHIAPGEKRMRVRSRIDGILFYQQTPPLAPEDYV